MANLTEASCLFVHLPEFGGLHALQMIWMSLQIHTDSRCLISLTQIFDGSDEIGGIVSVDNLNIIVGSDEMAQTINTALGIFGLTWIDISVLSVQLL